MQICKESFRKIIYVTDSKSLIFCNEHNALNYKRRWTFVPWKCT